MTSVPFAPTIRIELYRACGSPHRLEQTLADLIQPRPVSHPDLEPVAEEARACPDRVVKTWQNN